jgi:DNA-binding NarL/FixJ family response regulator
MVTALGHDVVAVAENGVSLIEQSISSNYDVDVVITGPLTLQMHGTDAASAIYRKRQIPIILLSDDCDRDLVLNAEHKHVFMVLVQPIRPDHLKLALEGCRSLRSSSPNDGDAEEPEVLIADYQSYSGGARYRVPSRPAFSSSMARLAN